MSRNKNLDPSRASAGLLTITLSPPLTLLGEIGKERPDPKLLPQKTSAIIAIPVTMNRCRESLAWAVPLLLCFLSASALGLPPQSYKEVTPEVQQLLVDAKAAQQQGDTAGAIKKYRDIIQLAPHLVPAYNNLGMLYLRLGEYKLAADTLERALELDPKMHSACSMLGITYFQLGLYDKAEPLLREALAYNAGDDNVEMTLVLILMDRKKYDEAESHLNNYLHRNPKNLQAWYLLRKGHLEMSEEARARINEIDPDSVLAHEIAGEIEENNQNYAGAIAEYQKAIAKAPHQAGTHMPLGNAYWRIGKWEAAQAEFKAELANNPNNCYAHWKLADAMLEANGSSEDAASELNQSINICPKLVEARVDRARALIRLGKHSDALPDLLMAEKEQPSEPTIHFLLGSVYRAQGKAAEAEKEMHTFEQLKSRSTGERR